MNQKNSSFTSLTRFQLRRGLTFGVIIITALFAFEIFNYSTTEFALGDLLGNLEFIGIRWATILAIAFCGIDFAGIARLFTPEAGSDGPASHNEVWYLFGAWLLAATMNAMLTWWGVSLALLEQDHLGNAVVGRDTLLRVAPIFVAVLVWLIRVLIIGTFSVAGDRLFSQDNQRVPVRERSYARPPANPLPSPAFNNHPQPTRSTASRPLQSAPKPSMTTEPSYARPEPTYHQLSINAQPGVRNSNQASFRSGFPLDGTRK